MSLWNHIKSLWNADPAETEPATPEPAPPEPAEEPPPSGAPWMTAEDPDNPFEVPILNLMDNLGYLSTSKDPLAAETALSWRTGHQRRLSTEPIGEWIDCELSFPIESPFYDGMLFVPRVMEDKWVIAWVDGHIVIARSWSGQSEAVAEASVEGSNLVVRRLSEGTGLSSFGDPVACFEWLMRTHAYQEKLPLPVSAEGAELLQTAPLTGMNIHGHRLFAAARDYTLPPPAHRIGSDGDLVEAVVQGNLDELARLKEEGASMDARALEGQPLIQVAMFIDDSDPTVEKLLELGADVEAPDQRGTTPLQRAIVQKRPSTVSLLLKAGADIHAVNEDGFTALHAAAEIGMAELVPMLVDHGADVHATTRHGHPPLHIACALGHVDAARALLGVGGDLTLKVGGMTPVEVATAEGQEELVRNLLD